MTQSDFRQRLYDAAEHTGHHLSVCYDADKRLFVKFDKLQNGRFAVLKLVPERQDTSQLINDIIRECWNHPTSEVVIDVAGELRQVVNAAMESQNWKQLPYWEKCVIVETA